MVGLASAGSGVAVGSGVGVAVGCGVEVGAAVGCGVSAAIVAVGAAAGLYAGGVAISKVITAVKKPKTDQDKRITQLETRVNAMEGFLRNDKQRLDRMDEGQHVTMQALLALLDHNLDGNNIDQMQKAKEALQKHLIG